MVSPLSTDPMAIAIFLWKNSERQQGSTKIRKEKFKEITKASFA